MTEHGDHHEPRAIYAELAAPRLHVIREGRPCVRAGDGGGVDPELTEERGRRGRLDGGLESLFSQVLVELNEKPPLPPLRLQRPVMESRASAPR